MEVTRIEGLDFLGSFLNWLGLVLTNVHPATSFLTLKIASVHRTRSASANDFLCFPNFSGSVFSVFFLLIFGFPFFSGPVRFGNLYDAPFRARILSPEIIEKSSFSVSSPNPEARTR